MAPISSVGVGAGVGVGGRWGVFVCVCVCVGGGGGGGGGGSKHDCGSYITVFPSYRLSLQHQHAVQNLGNQL